MWIGALGCMPGDGGANTRPDDAFERWTLGPPSARIGGIEAHGGAQFSGIRQVVATGDEAVFISDSKTAAVLMFDSQGTLIRQIGGPGMGPGEFRSISGIGSIDDTLWVIDGSRRLAHFFRHDGKYLSNRPVPGKQIALGKGASTTFRPKAVMPGGRMVGFLRVPEPPPDAPIPPASASVGILGLFDTLGVAGDTLRWLVQGFGDIVLDVHPAIYFPGPNHFESTPLWAVADNGSGIVVVERPIANDSASARYTVTKWDALGSQAFRTDIPFTPVAFPRALVDSIVDNFAADMAELKYLTIPAAKAILRDSIPAPAYFPPVSDVFFGSDGRIWIAREGLVTPPFDARRYDALDASGKPLGTLRLDRPGKIMAATERVVWVVEVDSDDVPTLVRYPILRP